MGFSIDADSSTEHVIVTVTGDVDLATADAFREISMEALESSFGDVVIDLGEVTFIDSTGLDALIAVRRETEHFARRLALVVGRRTQAILRIAGLEELFETHPTLASALGEFDDLA